VWIGVEQPVNEHHAHVQFHHRRGKLWRAHPPRLDERGERIYGAPFHELEHQHPLPRHLAIHGGNGDSRVPGKVRADLLRVCRLLPEIHLVADSL